VLALACAAWAAATLVYLFARRLVYPYDLEWMEGGELCHALRLLDGRPLYAPPSLDFIPYLYTPLYPALVAALARLVGVGYLLGRALSIASFAGACALGYRFARTHGSSRATAAAGLAVVAGAFASTGAWYDLARPDSLWLLFTSAAVWVAWRRTHASAAAAALLLTAAFFTKQTASPFMVALALALLALDWRLALTYGATLAGVGLPLLYTLDRTSGGWFWTYVFKLHQSHGFAWTTALVATPVHLALLFGPGVLVIPWALVRARSPALVYAAWFALVGVAVAGVARGTQWAFLNALVPGVYFPSVALAMAVGRLASVGGTLRPTIAWLAVASSLWCAPGGLERASRGLRPRAWLLDAGVPTGYDPRPFIPTPADRVGGDALVARLRRAPGEVLIPFHPFYAHLAGKRTYLHRMGVMDILQAGYGAPRGLADAFATRRFALVVMDYKIDGTAWMWPGLYQSYRVAERIAGPRTVSGAPTAPRDLMEPIGAAGVIDRELQ
jgi:hypothetical protein